MTTMALSSLADFDQALRAAYQHFIDTLPGVPVPSVQRRFAQYGIFPKPGWALPGLGEAEALARQDPAVLHGMLVRFAHCAQACWGPADEQGLHFGGVDHCALVLPALYAAPLGRRGAAAAAFHGGRPMSTQGHPSLRHAANLMVSLDNPGWRFGDKALAKAQDWLAARGGTQADKAFVGFFLAIRQQDRASLADALCRFADTYLKSDWGRHKPDTQPVLLQAMLAYASARLPDPVDDATRRSLFSADRIALWAAFHRHLADDQPAPYRFAAPLDFLNDAAAG